MIKPATQWWDQGEEGIFYIVLVESSKVSLAASVFTLVIFSLESLQAWAEGSVDSAGFVAAGLACCHEHLRTQA